MTRKDSDPRAADEAEVDRLLGDRALIKLSAMQALGGPSPPSFIAPTARG
jgi:hypothetical protein